MKLALCGILALIGCASQASMPGARVPSPLPPIPSTFPRSSEICYPPGLLIEAVGSGYACRGGVASSALTFRVSSCNVNGFSR